MRVRSLFMWAAACGIAGVLLVSRDAVAQDAEDPARQAFRDGAALVEQSEWAGALAAFERSLSIRPHALTLYKHSSGALVFGAGTVQWAWGLDAVHDRAGTPSDINMRQATVNLFADMGVQPATIEGDLIATGPSTDTAAPTAVITSPTAGATGAVGSSLTISVSRSGLVAMLSRTWPGSPSW